MLKMEPPRKRHANFPLISPECPPPLASSLRCFCLFEFFPLGFSIRSFLPIIRVFHSQSLFSTRSSDSHFFPSEFPLFLSILSLITLSLCGFCGRLL
jgi:hypothetical protein